MSRGFTKTQKAELHALTRGPRGGRLRGRARPTAKEVHRALGHWPRKTLVPTMFGLILSGTVR